MNDVNKEKECVESIFNKLISMIKGGILNENYIKIVGTQPTYGMIDTSSRTLTMVNTANNSEKETFISSVLNDKDYQVVKNRNQSGAVISDAVFREIEEFITKIRSSIEVSSLIEVK